MSYSIKLRDNSVYTLEDIDGESLKNALITSNKPFMVELNNDTVLSSQIISIKKNAVSEPEINTYDQLPIGKKCRGQYSIQNEINNIARAENDKWQELIINKNWRDEVRLKLWSLNDEWCDYGKGTCFCE